MRNASNLASEIDSYRVQFDGFESTVRGTLMGKIKRRTIALPPLGPACRCMKATLWLLEKESGRHRMSRWRPPGFHELGMTSKAFMAFRKCW